MVDTSLAAHGRIHLGQQRGRHLDKGHTPHIAGCSVASHVAHHTTSRCKQDGLAVAAILQERIKDQVKRLPVLVHFAIG